MSQKVVANDSIGTFFLIYIYFTFLKLPAPPRAALSGTVDKHGKRLHPSYHLVSAVSGHLNLADLGTKRLAKKRLLELMCFCNLGFVENDIFTVIEDLQNVGHIQRINHVGNLIAQLTLVQNALSRLEDMIIARERARRIYEERRLQLVELGDLNALEALERNYEWVHHV